MALSILNNIPSLAAQNQLTITGAGLQQTLFRLSSGSRINSGADDAAGLAIADGLRANITALTQSSRNATDGVGKLQVADGALAQVTNLLNRAVTLSTEAATGTVSGSQRGSLNAEFIAIKAEIDRIGQKTTFNGQQIFQGGGSSTDPNTYVGASALGSGSATSLATVGQAITVWDTDTGKSESFTVAASSTAGDLMSKFNSSTNVAVVASLDATNHLQIQDANGNGSILVTANNIAELGAVARKTVTGGNSMDIYLGDGTTNGAGSITVTIGTLAANQVGFSSPQDLSTDNLLSATAAGTALDHINKAIANIANDRGSLGASQNRLSSAVNVINNQVQNLSAAEDTIRAADIAQEVANMTKFTILNQTGISALAQANQMQQSVLSLLR